MNMYRFVVFLSMSCDPDRRAGAHVTWACGDKKRPFASSIDRIGDRGSDSVPRVAVGPAARRAAHTTRHARATTHETWKTALGLASSLGSFRSLSWEASRLSLDSHLDSLVHGPEHTTQLSVAVVQSMRIRDGPGVRLANAIDLQLHDFTCLIAASFPRTPHSTRYVIFCRRRTAHSTGPFCCLYNVGLPTSQAPLLPCVALAHSAGPLQPCVALVSLIPALEAKAQPSP